MKALQIYLRVLFLLAPELALRQALHIFSTPRNKRPRPRDKQILTTATLSFEQAGAYRIATYRWGTSPKTVLLVHGWEGNAGNFGALVNPLLELGYSVLAFDAPAHHQSSGKQTNVVEFSEVVGKLALRNRVSAVIAHSMGSAATILALHDFAPATVKKVVLLSTPNRLLDVVQQFTWLMRLPKKGATRFTSFVQHALNRTYEQAQLSNLVQRLPQAMLIIHDEQDKILPYANAVAVAGSKPDSKLVTLSGAGHYRMLWNTRVIEQVTAFLN